MLTPSLAPEYVWAFKRACREFAAGDSQAFLKWRHLPVDIVTFVTDPYYLNQAEYVYPEVLAELRKIYELPAVDEIVATGGIGSAKTTVAILIQAYETYLLSLLVNPHKTFGLSPSSEIILIIQSLNETLAKEVDYARLRSLIGDSPYFQEHFMFDKSLVSKMVFPGRVEIMPVSGLETAAIGMNVIGGNIDEVNFMAIITGGKKGEGGSYDQAWSLYNSIARRRKTRFARAGVSLPGKLCLISSRKYPGQFTDIKEEEARTNKRIYVYDKRVWDIKPEGTYCGIKFRVFIGDEVRKPYILGADDVVPVKDSALIDYVPIEFLEEYKADILKSLRDFSGKSTLAIHPYMVEREKVIQCFGKRKSILTEWEHNLVSDPKLGVIKSRFSDLDCMRWAHVDLGVTGCSAGLSCVYVPGFAKVIRGGIAELLPRIAVDFSLAVPPPKNGEIDFASIRRLLIKLREMGLPIKWVSFDSFQSVDSQQILRNQGFVTGTVSTVTSSLPYDVTKQAFYDGRIESDFHPILQMELLTLERDPKTGKIDHPPGGTKDLADSLAGSVGSISLRREIWAHHKVPVNQSHTLAAIIAERDAEEKKKAAKRA